MEANEKGIQADFTGAGADWEAAPVSAFERWLDEEAVGKDGTPYSDVSKAQKLSMFRVFVRHLSDLRVTVLGVGSDHIAQFLTSLSGQHEIPARTLRKDSDDSSIRPAAAEITKHRYVELIDSVMNHLVVCGHRTSNPTLVASRVVKPRAPDPTPVFLDESQDRTLRDWLVNDIDTAKWVGRRSQAMLTFMLGSGVTSEQAINALRSNFALAGASATYAVPANEKEEGYLVPLSPFCVPVINAWLMEEEGGAFVSDSLAFPATPGGVAMSHVALYKQVRAALLAIGFDGNDVGPRVLRYTYCRRQLMAERHVEDVQAWMGLKTDRTIQRVLRTLVRARKGLPV
ncbi:tyrosine-type recombinase/integrase [Pandoraea sp. NPDC090278]|uniref:tyrosine-type recombinase/integrase n=1 Tax=Pandoraea sp. NPDC090278 TaxID=3364391 RepID=UPI00383B4BDB